MIYDVIVVGAGPGGSSAANFLAREGVKVLLLDKSAFPRDKVCGDGMTPQAVYWLDRLGCAADVLAHTKGCIKSADIIVNKEHVLTGGYPADTIYPDFAICSTGAVSTISCWNTPWLAAPNFTTAHWCAM